MALWDLAMQGWVGDERWREGGRGCSRKGVRWPQRDTTLTNARQSAARVYLSLALFVLCSVPPQVAGQAVPDTLAHPIVTACGARIDPVALVRGRAEEIRLTSVESKALGAIDRDLRTANRPLGVLWWTLQPDAPASSRAEITAALRTNYRDAVSEIRLVLGEDRWTELLAPPDRADPNVRCLLRSVAAIVG